MCYARTMCIFDAWASSSPLGYPCVKFCFCRTLHCWASSRRKLCTQSITHSVTQLIWFAGNGSFRFRISRRIDSHNIHRHKQVIMTKDSDNAAANEQFLLDSWAVWGGCAGSGTTWSLSSACITSVRSIGSRRWRRRSAVCTIGVIIVLALQHNKRLVVNHWSVYVQTDHDTHDWHITIHCL